MVSSLYAQTPWDAASPKLPDSPGDRRHLALHLPHWATDWLKRAERNQNGADEDCHIPSPPAGISPRLGEVGRAKRGPAEGALPHSSTSIAPPLALYEKQKGAMRLVELDAAAQHAGLFIGQSLSDARALVPNLLVREIDRAALAAAFADFADWHSDASPMVVLLTDKAAYGDLVLDITGVSHLFGGEAAMLRRLLARLEKLGFTARGAVADSVGAAWALAHFSPGTILEGDPAGALGGPASDQPAGADPADRRAAAPHDRPARRAYCERCLGGRAGGRAGVGGLLRG